MSDDFINQMNSMWGDDQNPDEGGKADNSGKPKGDKKGDKDADEDEPGTALVTHGGISFLPMPIPDARDRPATDPVQWKRFAEKFGFMPYESPEDEYKRNSFPLNLQTMLYRWAGLDLERRIFEIFSNDALRMERAKMQDIRKREMGLPDPKDPEDIRIQTAYQVQIAKDRIDYLKFLLEQNIDVTVEQYFRFAEGGTVIKEAVRPLQSTARARAERDLRLWIETYRLLTGQSGKNVEVRHGLTSSLTAVLDDRMKKNGHRDPDGYSLDELESAAKPQLPPAGTVEGEIIMPDNLEIDRSNHDDE